MPRIDLTCSAPLCWPASQERTSRPDLARFRQTVDSALSGLRSELIHLGARDVIVTANWRLGSRGWPLVAQPPISDPGVAVYFTLKGMPCCFPCDRWTTIAANIRAISLTVAALRGIARWGTRGNVSAAFAGFAALPATSNGHGTAWWEVLGVSPGASPEEIELAYRRLARVYHPDAGGSHEAFLRLAEAYQQARLRTQGSQDGNDRRYSDE